MKNAKRILSFVLTLVMILTSFPLIVLPAVETKAEAATKHVDFTVDFDYEYSNAEDALEAAMNKWDTSYDQRDHGSIRWKHVTEDKRETLTDYLESDKSDEKYIVLDKSVSWTIGYSTWNPIRITHDKVLDLNGHDISFMDKRNKVDRHGKWVKDEYFQSSESIGFNSHMFVIDAGATLTIIDSSGDNEGEVSINAYMINPYKHRIKRYTNRDLFWINDGNLVVYGGTFRAGRAKQQSDDDPWTEIKGVIGATAQLASDVAGYASPINEATGALKDIQFNAQDAIKALAGKNGDEDDSGNTNASKTDTSTGGTLKKDGVAGNPTKEEKKETPAGDSDDKTRNATVGEKDAKNGDGKDNKANDKGTGKENDTNSKTAKAQNQVLKAATDKDAIGKMVDSAFGVVDAIKNLFGTNENSIVTQSFLGTPVHVGNAGAFVSYGGVFQGYGMTPNARNAVVEVTPANRNADGMQTSGGKAYIYGGTFEGYTGANIFNIVKANNGTQSFTQYVEDLNGGKPVKTTVTVPPEETAGLEVIYFMNDKPVDTSNIMIRGGTFRNFFEYNMLGLNEDDPEKAAGNHDTDNMTMFPGSAGGINVGIESFSDDLIRDGRIQINDNYGDGALVLMDEERGPHDLVNHYRLYCSDEELRLKQYITVYPNDSLSNSTYSFALETRYGNADTGDDVSKIWTEDENNKRAPYSSDEVYFTYPINNNTSQNYYVVPRLSDTDVYGEHLDESDVWYYNTPVSYTNEKISTFRLGENIITGVPKKQVYTVSTNQHTDTKKNYDNTYGGMTSGTAKFTYETQDYFTTLKWLTYKVYRVDPLTRENLTDKYGEDQPILTACYGASAGDALKCRLPIPLIEEYSGTQFEPGEMYRIVLSVEEYARFGKDISETKLKTAKCESSILFLCYDKSELKAGGDAMKDVDFTPVQWISEPQAGETATVRLVNGKAGQADWQTRKIFDVYYQWYAVDPDTGKETMIAGTDNIYDDTSLKDYNKQSWEYVNPASTKYKYLDTKPLSSDPADWTNEQLHSYIQANADRTKMTKDGSKNITLDNNNVFYSNTDSCYIPEEYEGYDIYCKVIALNNFWPLNYDHRQTFSSHTVKVDGPTRIFRSEMTLSQPAPYASKTNPAKINVTIPTDGYNTKTEHVGNVTIYVKNGIRMYLKKYTAADLDKNGKLPTTLFPNDFVSADMIDEIPGCSQCDVYVSAKKYKGDKWEMTATGHKQVLNYQVAAETFNVTYLKSCYYDSAYHVLSDYAAEKFRAEVYPAGASINYLLKENNNFTTTDKSVATLSEDGKLVLGGKTGTTTLTIKNPNGTKQTIKIVVPIKKVEVGGIEAPVIGKALDTTATVPTDAGYKIVRVEWVDVVTDSVLPAGTEAQPYHQYIVRPVVGLKDGNEFDVYQYGSTVRSTEVDTALTYTDKDGNTQTDNSREYADYDEVLSEVELSHRFEALTVNGKTTIDTLNVDFPTDVDHGSSVTKWLEQVHVYSDAGDAMYLDDFRPLYSDLGDKIAEGYGYETGIYFESFPVFVRDYQTGIYIYPRFKDGTGAKWADKVNVMVNGKLWKTIDTTVTSIEGNMQLSIENCLNIRQTDVELIPAPAVETSPIETAVGETIDIRDYINITGGGYNAEDISCSGGGGKFDIYLDGTATAKTASSAGDYELLYAVIPVDIDNDGIADMKKEVRIPVIVRASASAKTAPDAKLTVKVLDPSGNTAETKVYTKKALGVYGSFFVNIPEVENAFVSSVTVSAADTDTKAYITDGFNELEIESFSGDTTVTVKTKKAATPTVGEGATNVYFDSACPTMYYSVDGVCWTPNDQMENMTPDTEYTLYYKQGRYGTVYTDRFTTAKNEYAIVGRTPVTEKNLGDLERDGWHYDVASSTLTIKDLKIKSKGGVAGHDDLWGFGFAFHGRIASAHDLTLEVLGDNLIEFENTGDIVAQGILVYGDLTVKGTGNLTIDLANETNSLGVRGIYATGKVVLEGPGKLTVNGDTTPKMLGTINYGGAVLNTGVSADGGVTVKGQELELNVYDYIGTAQEAFDVGKGKTVTVENANGHTASVSIAGAPATATFTADDCLNAVTSFKVLYNHSFSKEVATDVYYASGSCDTGAKYYKSCACGYTDRSAQFTAAKGSHDLVKVAAQKGATCVDKSWDAYEYCTKCAYTTYKAKADGTHTFTYHNAKAVTCTASGYEAYYTCSVCGESTKVTIPATGHDIVKHSSKKPTCTEVGWDAYESCSKCSYTTYKEKAPLGHTLGTAKTERAATCTQKGLKVATCSVCGSVVRTNISKKAHTEVTDKAVAATCTKSGKTKGSHCSVCGEVITAQKTVAKLGHSYKSTVIVKATTSKSGKLQDKCSRCGYTKSSSTTIPMIKSATLSTTTYTYNGKTKSPTVTVKDSKGNKLVKGTDYTVSYSNNKNIGKATAKITFKGKYSGTKSLSYKIIPGKVTGLKATQTTSSVKLTWTKVSGAKTYRVYKYSSTTKKYTQITSTTGTSCTVKNLKAGTAYTYYVRASKTVSGTTYYSSAYTPIKTGTKTLTPKAPTLTAGTKKITVKWSKVTGASGYEVQMKKGSSGKYSKIYGSTGTSYTKTSLTKGSTYYFKVRAYKTVDGKNIYSAYSKEKYTKAK